MKTSCFTRTACLLVLAGSATAAFVNAFVPSFRGAPLAEFAGWEDFLSPVGGSNPPDHPGTTPGEFDLVQTEAGAVLAGDVIYGLANPATFVVSHRADVAVANPDVDQVVLQVRVQGTELNYGGVTLDYDDGNGVVALRYDTHTELYRESVSGLGEDVEHLYTWDLSSIAEVIPAYELSFAAFGPHMGLDAVELDAQWESLAEVYCTAGTSASGCAASIGASGSPSATAASGFFLTATGVEGAGDGVFFYGANGRQASPWGNGTSFRCVLPPVKRGGLLTGSGTSGACDGTFQQDLNARWCTTCTKPGHNPGVGSVMQAQLWYRDPMNTSNQTTSLSNAVEFTVAP